MIRAHKIACIPRLGKPITLPVPRNESLCVELGTGGMESAV
jgi:hypothetical protein